MDLADLQKLCWSDIYCERASTIMNGNLVHVPARITEVHKHGFHALGGEGAEIMLPPDFDAAAGDWFMLNQKQPSKTVFLERPKEPHQQESPWIVQL